MSSPRASADEAAESARTASSSLPAAASSANAREKSRSPVAVAAARPPSANTVGAPAPEGGPVEDVVVDQRGHVQQLHRHRGAQGRLGVAVRAEEHEQRAQPLAAGAQSARRVARELRAVALGHLRQPRLGPVQQPRQLGAAGGEDLPELILGRVHALVPACSAMMPPAVRIQRTSPRPASTIFAASPFGPGKRRTELGRYE